MAVEARDSFVAVHLSVAGGDAGGEGVAGERDLSLLRYSAFQMAPGMALDLHTGRAKVAAELAVQTY